MYTDVHQFVKPDRSVQQCLIEGGPPLCPIPVQRPFQIIYIGDIMALPKTWPLCTPCPSAYSKDTGGRNTLVCHEACCQTEAPTYHSPPEGWTCGKFKPYLEVYASKACSKICQRVGQVSFCLECSGPTEIPLMKQQERSLHISFLV